MKITKGDTMNIKKNKSLLKEAINSGCRTAAQLAHFLKVRSMLQEGYISF